MKAKKIDMGVAGYFHQCNLCDDLMNGEITEMTMIDVRRAYNACDGDWMEPELIENYEVTILTCRDGCRTDDSDDMWNLDEVWYCGKCQTKHTNRDDAEECCR